MYSVVSGLRRSGTSLMMLALRQSGVPVIGGKYYFYLGAENEDKIKAIVSERWMDKDLKKLDIDCNPNGYWETGVICTEIGLIDEAKYMGMKGDVIKIMVECLFKSKPEMVDRVILMFREPRRALYSMTKNNSVGQNWEEIELFAIKHLIDLIDSYEFIKRNNIPHKIVLYEDLLANPFKEFRRVCKFINNGNPHKAASIVEQKLNRSKQLEGKFKNVETMEKVYEWAKEDKLDNLLKIKDQLVQEAKKDYEVWTRSKVICNQKTSQDIK